MPTWVLVLITAAGQVTTVSDISSESMCQRTGIAIVNAVSETKAAPVVFTCAMTIKVGPL